MLLYYYLILWWSKQRHVHKALLWLRPAGVAAELVPALVMLAAEDEGRTEEPTERRREKERERGRVPKSAEIPAALVALGALIALFFSAGWILSGLAKMIQLYVGNFSELPAIDEAQLMPLLISLIRESAILLAPVFIIAMIMALVGNVAQTGFMFTLKPLEPDFSRIALTFKNLAQRVLFSRQVVVNLIKTIIKVVLLAWVSYFIIAGDFVAVMKSSGMGVGQSLKMLGFIAFKLAAILTFILLLMSLPDYLYQRYEFTESIKMTKQEVKEEYRETEGDPLVRQRQRQRLYQMMNRSMLNAVPEADVVITNPTHYAVALRYDNKRENAPRVIAKGVDQMAFLIRKKAAEHGVEIIPSPHLARQLYATVEINQEVPEQFYTVLLSIFKELYRKRELARAAR